MPKPGHPHARLVMTRRLAMLMGVGVLAAGCGFRPMYATRADGAMGSGTAGLAEISVGLIPERAGQLLRQALQTRLERGGTGIARRFDLTVSFGVTGDSIAIQRDNSTSRVRLIGVAHWTLTAQDPQRSTLSSGTARSVDAYNILDQQYFAADMENEMVQRRIAEAVADQITLQLVAYFNQHAAS